MPVKNPNLILIFVYAMKQISIFPLILANTLAAPGRNRELYSCLERIEDELGQQEFKVVSDELDKLDKPGGDHSAAIQILASKIDEKSLCEIGSYSKLEVRKILRLHIQGFDANFSNEEKRDLANKLAVPGCNQELYKILLKIEELPEQQAFDVFMELHELTKPNGNQNGAAINVLKQNEWVIALIYPFLRDDVDKIICQCPELAVIVADIPPPRYYQRPRRRFR